MPSYQIPLQIKLNDSATFENFQSEANEQLVSILQSGEPFVYYWSTESFGKSHLAQAVCQNQANSFYLSMTELNQWQPDIFEGLESFDLISLDDIQFLAGQADWEQALFNLFNRVRDSGKRLRVSANTSPNNLGIQLKDLLSRLTWGVTQQLLPISDEAKVRALSERAKQRGFSLSDDVANYLLKHCPRDMKSLFAILDKLDNASLQAQRKITIPFIKQSLNL